jgi:hypothetical protein
MIKEITEAREGRLGRGVQEVLVDDHQRWFIVMIRQVDKAALLVNPPSFFKHGSFRVGKGFSKELLKYFGRVAMIAEMKEE